MLPNRSVVCTFLEGHYHHGVAALTNSLYCQGFRGEIYVGYRGNLPAWSTKSEMHTGLNWLGSSTLLVAPDLYIHFLPLDTPYHMSNYKPYFMIRLWEEVASEAKAMFYFDPDIVVTTPWQTFETWVECGVALCEDMNSPMPEHHPIRTAWRRYFAPKGITLSFKEAVYANAGFVGLNKENISFLAIWKQLLETIAPTLGGLNNCPAFTGNDYLPLDPFSITDQDALNASVEVWEGVVSLIGQEAMAFKSGSRLMSHAIGKSKPWLINPLTQAMAGRPPRLADKDYWRMAEGPIVTQPAGLVRRRKWAIKVASFVSRFYSKNT